MPGKRKPSKQLQELYRRAKEIGVPRLPLYSLEKRLWEAEVAIAQGKPIPISSLDIYPRERRKAVVKEIPEGSIVMQIIRYGRLYEVTRRPDGTLSNKWQKVRNLTAKEKEIVALKKALGEKYELS